MNNGKFTPTEKRILTVLSDGLPHTRQELHRCLSDELAELSAIQPHISRIRRRLQNKGQDIVCVLCNRQIQYQHVRILNSAYDGTM